MTTTNNVLFDRIIDVKLVSYVRLTDDWVPGVLIKGHENDIKDLVNREQNLVTEFTCPRSGLKPDVRFSANLIPGKACYQARLTITNFSLIRGIDIRTFHTMVVTVGYRDAGTRTFTCPIFSSWISKPNPGGEAVFLGLTVGAVGTALMQKSSYQFRIHHKEMLPSDFVKQVMEPLGYTVATPRGLDDKHMSIPIHTAGLTLTTDTALAVANWVSEELHKWGATIGLNVSLLLEDNTAVIIGSDVPDDADETEFKVALDIVKSASFTGPQLTVIAPYVPDLIPGRLFTMPTHYYSGDMLPNAGISGTEIGIVNKETKLGLFRALTVNIDFATTQRINQMTVVAVPALNYTEDPDSQYDIGKAQELVDIAQRKQAVVSIEIGTPEAPAEEDIPPKDMWSAPYSDPAGVTHYTIKSGDTLEALAKKFYGTELFTLKNSERGDMPKNTLHNADGIPLYFFFPLMMISTYKASLISDRPTGYTYNDQATDRLNNPDRIQVDKLLEVPSLSVDIIRNDMIGKSMFSDYFFLVRDFYRNKGNVPYADNFEDIANYLKYGDV